MIHTISLLRDDGGRDGVFESVFEGGSCVRADCAVEGGEIILWDDCETAERGGESVRGEDKSNDGAPSLLGEGRGNEGFPVWGRVMERRLVVDGEPGISREEEAGVTGGRVIEDNGVGFAGLEARELDEDWPDRNDVVRASPAADVVRW
jgi:hypothetical protein